MKSNTGAQMKIETIYSKWEVTAPAQNQMKGLINMAKINYIKLPVILKLAFIPGYN